MKHLFLVVLLTSCVTASTLTKDKWVEHFDTIGISECVKHIKNPILQDNCVKVFKHLNRCVAPLAIEFECKFDPTLKENAMTQFENCLKSHNIYVESIEACLRG